jgi:predicted ABC-type ATPase
MESPYLIILAGPNGAGKTTLSKPLLQGVLEVPHFVNADSIAYGLSAFKPESVQIAAGRIMLERIKELSAKKENFAFETTLGTRSFIPIINKLAAGGYQSHLVFLALRAPEMAIARVAGRVKLGGHNIPESDIRRRYQRGLINLFTLYMPQVTSWQIFNNSLFGNPVIVARGGKSLAPYIFDEQFYEYLLTTIKEAKRTLELKDTRKDTMQDTINDTRENAKRSAKDPKGFETLLKGGPLIIKALKVAGQKAGRKHVAYNEPIVSWENGKIRYIEPAELIQILNNSNSF